MRVLSHLLDLVYFKLKGGVYAARRKGVKVGIDCRIYIRSFGSEPFLIKIGDRSTITSGVRILTHDGSTCLVRNENGRRYQRYAPVVIGDDVFIGINSIIMPGITVKSRSIVGAGSVVTRDVDEGTVVAGNPARLICTFEDYAARVRLQCPNDDELSGSLSYEQRVFRAIDISQIKLK